MFCWSVLAGFHSEAVSANEMKRIGRLLTPRQDGTLLVPKKIVDMWKDVADGGRDEVKKLWLQVQGNKDWW